MNQALREILAITAKHWLVRGQDLHAVVLIELADAYHGVSRHLNLQIPTLGSEGVPEYSDRQCELRVPKGVREGQQLCLRGQGAAGLGDAPAGDLYLEVAFLPHPPFRLDARDVYLDLQVTSWEAALGATVTVPTPTGAAQLAIPPGSVARQRLQLKGLGLPGSPPGDLYAMLNIVRAAADGAQAQNHSR